VINENERRINAINQIVDEQDLSFLFAMLQKSGILSQQDIKYEEK
jgi:hypothetical protein